MGNFLRLALVGFFCIWTTPSDARPLEAESGIDRVVVYPDRARVTRTARIALPAGESAVRIADLPVALDDATIQAAAQATGGLTLLGTEVRRRFAAEAVDEKVRSLQRLLRDVEDRIADLETEAAANERQSELLAKLPEIISGEGDENTGVSLAEVREIYAFHEESLRALGRQDLRFQRAIRDLVPERDRLRREIERLQAGAKTEDKEVLIAFRAEEQVTADIELSYNIGRASWTPLYDARIRTDSGELELTYFGVVRQNTGEDWNQARLALSTARPAAGAVVPELPPWWIRLYEPPVVTPAAPEARVRRAEPDALMMMATPPDGAAEPAIAAEIETADIRTAGVTTVFDAPLPATIPSDNEPHRVTLARADFEGTVEAVAVPKLSRDAYLRAEVVNTSGAPLLAGRVNLFRDGDFVGTSHLRLTAPEETFEFSLGVDDGIRVEQKLVLDREERAGLLRRRKGLARKYETEIENLTRAAIRLVVLDHIPVSQSDEVQVTGVKLNPRPDEQDKQSGELTWELELEPGETQTLAIEFTVEWPEDKQIMGL